MTENIDFYQNQIALARTEIKNLRLRISALKYEHQKEINHVRSTLNDLRCANCAAEATTVVSHQESVQPSVSQSNDITFHPIGHIETTFTNKRAVPRQSSVLANAKGVIILDTNIFNNPQHALSGLEDFSHIWIIYYFHMTVGSPCQAKVSPPRLGGERCGVLSTRSPNRPCRIGLSLVKLRRIDGNKIYFNGVDMVNGTPILDIKPFIPQYDYPQSENSLVLTSLIRPPTEGISDAAETLTNLQLDDDSYTNRSVSPRLVQPLGIDISPLPSPGNELTPVSPQESPSSDLLDGPIISPIDRIERGDPDGQERFTPPQSALNINQDGIRVASWVINPPTQRYHVAFTEDALQRLNDLIGDRAAAFKSNIESLLSEDPRSVYVRTRYPDHEYSCVLEDLSISCVFNENSCTCTIIAVRNAEDLQN